MKKVTLEDILKNCEAIGISRDCCIMPKEEAERLRKAAKENNYTFNININVPEHNNARNMAKEIVKNLQFALRNTERG